MRKILLLMLSFLTTSMLIAQTGEIQGKVVDTDTGEGLPFATVSVVVNGSLQGSQTDFDGFYSIKPVPPGNYEVTVQFLGYQKNVTQGVLVNADRITFHDVDLVEESQVLETVVIKEYRVPLIKPDETSTGGTVTKEDIANLPTRNVASIASTTAGVYQSDEGESLNVKGARSASTDYYIDGIKVRGSIAVPAASIEQLNVVTGGVPARYGDATGGIINITTRGPSQEYYGGVEAITSKYLDAFDYNLLTGSISGPLFVSKKGTNEARPLLGFFIAGELELTADDDPSILGITKLKDDVYQEIYENPIASGLLINNTIPLKADLLGADDLENVDARVNAEKIAYNFTGKFDFQPVKNVNVTVGGNYAFRDGGIGAYSDGYNSSVIRRYELMNWNNYPFWEELDYRTFVRFTHRFGQKTLTAENADEQSAFQNAYYSIQFDYSKSKDDFSDDRHRDNYFDYGYVGKFTENREESFSQADINVDGPNGEKYILNGRQFDGISSNGINYESDPNATNPEITNYMDQWHNVLSTGLGPDLFSQFIPSISAIEGGGGILPGMVNGNRFEHVYNMYYTPGQHFNLAQYDDRDQYRLSFNGSVDYKKKGASERNKHAIEFGFEYEQRVDSRYQMESPDNLWDRMRTNISQIGPAEDIRRDLDNPLLLIDGAFYTYNDDLVGTSVDYNDNSYTINAWDPNETAFSSYDTIYYEYERVNEGSYFDQVFRDRFGFGNLDYVNTDEFTPDQLSLDLFSPDDLFGAGNRDNIVSYYGYDYLGNKLDYQPAFEDFFTSKKTITLSNGNDVEYFDRPMGAFRPVYSAFYIQDKFNFKDLIFNIGVRVDRYDANTTVLKDEFSLYGVRTAGEVGNIGGSEVVHPGTIGEDFVVYVDDELNPSKINGYRDGDEWYNSEGTFIKDPRILEEGGNVLPYLSNPLSDTPQSDIKLENFVSDGAFDAAFEDYDPQISVMPRIAFSFPVTDEALFFAHYNVLTQRPQGRTIATPHNYYFFSERAVDNTFNNPNLKPEKTVDYQIGFQQKMSSSSVIKIAAFYRELRDMVQVLNIPYAYPITYNTYGNVDFGTVKGFEMTYDLRRTGNIRMLLSYTLQFADGTGSSDRSQVDLVGSGQPNLRSIQALDFDARHLINLQMDYRYGSGKNYSGPTIGGKDILQDFGMNLTFRGRSGTPYSKYRTASIPGAVQFGVAGRTTIDGELNGSRLPWNFDADLRVDKSFELGGNTEGKDPLDFNVYLMFQNLLNRQNVVNVYSFTGNAEDDGWLSSALGVADAETRTDPDAYRALYGAKMLNPNYYAQARTIRLGASISF